MPSAWREKGGPDFFRLSVLTIENWLEHQKRANFRLNFCENLRTDFALALCFTRAPVEF